LNFNQTCSGRNTSSDRDWSSDVCTSDLGAFTGNGAGLSNITATATNGVVTLAGDVTGSSSNSTVARLRGVNVLATAPAANQVLRSEERRVGKEWGARGRAVSGKRGEGRL